MDSNTGKALSTQKTVSSRRSQSMSRRILESDTEDDSEMEIDEELGKEAGINGADMLMKSMGSRSEVSERSTWSNRSCKYCLK